MIKLTDEQIKQICHTFKWDDSWASVRFAHVIQSEVLRLNGRCEYCHGTGDVHDRTGEWRGVCTACDAAKPRATGCPETMDDTARFAADELPAILKKQAG